MNYFLPSGLEAPPSNYLSKITKILTILCIAQSVLGVFLLVGDASSGLSLVIESLLLYCTIRSYNVCMCTVYILLAFLELVNGGYYIGMFFTAYLYDNSLVGRRDVVPMFKVPLFLLSTYYCFLLYREVKAAFIDNGINAGLIEPARTPARSQPSFQGQGYRLNR